MSEDESPFSDTPNPFWRAKGGPGYLSPVQRVHLARVATCPVPLRWNGLSDDRNQGAWAVGLKRAPILRNHSLCAVWRACVLSVHDRESGQPTIRVHEQGYRELDGGQVLIEHLRWAAIRIIDDRRPPVASQMDDEEIYTVMRQLNPNLFDMDKLWAPCGHPSYWGH